MTRQEDYVGGLEAHCSQASTTRLCVTPVYCVQASLMCLSLCCPYVRDVSSLCIVSVCCPCVYRACVVYVVSSCCIWDSFLCVVPCHPHLYVISVSSPPRHPVCCPRTASIHRDCDCSRVVFTYVMCHVCRRHPACCSSETPLCRACDLNFSSWVMHTVN